MCVVEFGRAAARINKVKRKNGGKKREKNQKIRVFDGFFEKWGGWR
jgi:hypothetical protein